MAKWKSPLLSPTTDGGSDGGTPVPDDVQQSLTDSSLLQSTTSSVTVSVSGWYGLSFGTPPPSLEESQGRCYSHCVAHFQSKDGQQSGSLTLPLPFETDWLTSIHVGRLLYLPANASVSCCLDSSESSCATCQWRLVFQRKDDEQSHQLAELAATSKSLVCAECRRTFASLKSIQSHVQAMHVSTEKRIVLPSVLQQPLEVAYQDEVMAVVVKPQGIAVMGDRQTLSKSDLFLPLAASRDKSEKGVFRKPVAVHRLDAATGGLLVLAKTKAAEIALKGCFASRSCHKRYRAVVFGRLEPQHQQQCGDGLSLIDAPVSGKRAVTKYSVVRYTRSPDHMAAGEWLTTVDLFPITGRRHQLRRHMKMLGHAIWGDKRYGPYYAKDSSEETEAVNGEATTDLYSDNANIKEHPHSRMSLWAVAISFPHPTTGAETVVSIPEPTSLHSLVAHQEELWSKRQKF